MKIEIKRKTRLRLLRTGYWLGIVLDALAFFQMAFPELGRRMLGVNTAPTAEYVFAINLGAGLMLGWTLLLFWADRKPVERRGIIPLTMVVLAWNIMTMLFGIREGIVPAASLIPQVVVAVMLLFYYAFCTFHVADMSADGNAAAGGHV